MKGLYILAQTDLQMAKNNLIECLDKWFNANVK